MKKYLQVHTNSGWQYVFSNNEGTIKTCTDKRKALGADALPYFERKFANHSFRVIQEPQA